MIRTIRRPFGRHMPKSPITHKRASRVAKCPMSPFTSSRGKHWQIRRPLARKTYPQPRRPLLPPRGPPRRDSELLVLQTPFHCLAMPRHLRSVGNMRPSYECAKAFNNSITPSQDFFAYQKPTTSNPYRDVRTLQDAQVIYPLQPDDPASSMQTRLLAHP